MPLPPNPHKPAFIAAILRGEPLKVCGDTAGITKQRASQWAAELGFRRRFLTDDEWRDILKKRNDLTL